MSVRMKNKWWKKGIAVLLAGLMTIGLAGCGGDDAGNQEEDVGSAGVDGYVYVPEFHTLDLADDVYPGNPLFVGEEMYYTSYVWDDAAMTGGYQVIKRDLSSGAEEELKLEYGTAENASNPSINCMLLDADGNLILILNAYPLLSEEAYDYDYEHAIWQINRYDQEGNLISSADISEAMTSDTDNTYVQYAVIDADGRIYVTCSNLIRVFDSEGGLVASVDAQSDWISGIGVSKEGKVYISKNNSVDWTPEIAEIDVENQTLGTVHQNVPGNGSNYGIMPAGIDTGLLISTSSALYQYDPETETSEQILTWTDSDITGNYVNAVTILDDGRLLVYSNNYSSTEVQFEVAYLTKTEASQVTQKEQIVIATLYSGNQTLEQNVVDFNKASDKYHISIRYYIDDSAEWTENTYSDGIAAMNSDITSSNCPDIIDLSYGNIANYVSKGLLEDLGPYLDSSTVLNRSDFLENVLEAYTIDGCLATIPRTITVSTLAGRASQLGDRSGWTISEIIEFADSYPDASLLQFATKQSILYSCLAYSSDTFIDYTTGQCNFDSEEFIQVLEFANRFDDEYVYDEDFSLPDQIHEGKILLEELNLYDIQEYQMYTLMFEEPLTFVGYPTVDGKNGSILQGQTIYGISTKSEHKDGAWAFMESILGYEPFNSFSSWGFSSRKDMLEDVLADAARPDYVLDENGDPALDENGDPIENPKTTWGYDNWEAEIYAATQEQVDTIRDMVYSAQTFVNNDSTIYEMIYEEVQSYFEGQKTAQEVAEIVQSRVKIYIDESM